MKCVECEERRAAYMDPREPPLEIDNCLCKECDRGSCQDRMEELEEEIDDLKREIESLRPKKKPRKRGKT